MSQEDAVRDEVVWCRGRGGQSLVVVLQCFFQCEAAAIGEIERGDGANGMMELNGDGQRSSHVWVPLHRLTGKNRAASASKNLHMVSDSPGEPGVESV